MPQRILSISGLRGVIGDGLDPGYLVEFAAACGTLMRGGTVVVSRDGRSTGLLVKHAVLAGLQSVGCHVLDADISSTPTVGVLVQHHGAAGGLQIAVGIVPDPAEHARPRLCQRQIAASDFDMLGVVVDNLGTDSR